MITEQQQLLSSFSGRRYISNIRSIWLQMSLVTLILFSGCILGSGDGVGFDGDLIIINDDIVVKIHQRLFVRMENETPTKVRVRLVIKDPNGIEISTPEYYQDLEKNGGTAIFNWKCNVSEENTGLNYKAFMQKNDGTYLNYEIFHVAKPMVVEYDHMAGLDVWNGHLDDSSRKEVLDIFKEVVLDLNMDPDEQNLPDYIDENGNPAAFPDIGYKLIEYVTAHYNSILGYSWHMLAVDNFVWNGPTYQGTPGITIFPPAPNQVHSNVSERYSFIFVQDIDNYADYEGWSIEKTDSLKWEVIAHELGHQRAGLTHPLDTEGSQYHNQLIDLDETYGEDAVCIMQSNAWGWLPGGEIRFCTQDYPYQDAYYQHNSTCLGNIITNLNAN